MACKFRESGHKLSFVNITVKVYRLSDYIYTHISQNLQVTSLYGIYIILWYLYFTYYIGISKKYILLQI